MSIRFNTSDAGCYLDGHFGWHNTYRVVELAQQHGFALSAADAGFVDAFRNGARSFTPDDSTTPYDFAGIADAVSEIATEALDYLQSVTADGLVWDWDCGELSLSVIDDTEGE